MFNEPRPTVPRDFAAFGDWMNAIFRLWGANTMVWILQGLIFFCIAVLPAFIFYFIFMGSMFAGGFRQPPAADSEMLGLMLVMYGLVFLGSIFSVFLYPGMVSSAIRQMRGEQITSTDIFSGMRYGLGYIAVSFLTGLGVLACFVGVYALNGLLFLALPLMIDKGYSTSQAISTSWDTTKQNFWLYVLFSFVVLLLGGVGASACYIGMIITMPFMAIGQAVAYERTFNATNLPPLGMEKPNDFLPPPPYTGGNSDKNPGSSTNIWK